MKVLHYLFIWSFMIVGVGTIGSMASSHQDDLYAMQQILEKEKNVTIERWSITARETVDSITSKSEFAYEINRMKEENPEFKWTVTHDSSKYLAVGLKNSVHFQETIRIASTIHSKQESYITYEIKGKSLRAKLIPKIEKTVKNRKQVVFSGNTTFFTCIEGSISDTIDRVLTSTKDRWMENFKAQEVESLKEEQFISITAKSLLFKQSTISNNYNFQLAMRSDGMGSSTSFVIGTPIITFEY